MTFVRFDRHVAILWGAEKWPKPNSTHLGNCLSQSVTYSCLNFLVAMCCPASLRPPHTARPEGNTTQHNTQHTQHSTHTTNKHGSPTPHMQRKPDLQRYRASQGLRPGQGHRPRPGRGHKPHPAPPHLHIIIYIPNGVERPRVENVMETEAAPGAAPGAAEAARGKRNRNGGRTRGRAWGRRGRAWKT